MNIINKVRNLISGYKTYMAGVATILTTLVAWSTGELEFAHAVLAVILALEVMFLRAGVAKITEEVVA